VKKIAAKKRPASGAPVYVAVVMRKGVNFSNREPHKDWSCFVDAKKEDAVKRALTAACDWVRRYGEYDICVGKLTESVFVPVQFKFEKL
jgi:hypothetical protein